MLLRRNAIEAMAIVAVVLLLAGCGTETIPTTSTTTTAAPQSTTSQPAETTSTNLPTGPQPFPGGAILKPGDYVTTIFEPRVQFRIEQTHALTAFQDFENVGLQNIFSKCTNCVALGTKPYRGVAVHNWWSFLTPEEIIVELGEFETIDYGSPTPIEVDGFPATQVEGTVPQVINLWVDRSDDDTGSWWLHADQRIRFIIVETPAGSMLITIAAHVDEFDDFLPRAEEILAGISFPDLD